MEPNRELKPDLNWRMALVTVGIAMSLPGTIVVPAFLGYYLDGYFDTKPILLIVGFSIGLISAGVEGYILIKRVGKMK